jgi:tripartite-type tricarboxylate transporter receptor subunit TctC
MTVRTALVAAAMLAAFCVDALAQGYPARPVRIIIPNPPGGIDAYARVMMPRFGEDLGQPMVVENRPGASGIIGSEIVARAPADGYTLLYATSAILVSVPFFTRNMPFDVLKDFTPVSQLVGIVSTLSVNAASPFKSVADLVAYAKKNPGKLSYGSTGIGTLPHLNGEILKVTAGIDLLHVPFKGTQQLMTEMLAGRIDVDLTGMAAVSPHAASGKLRILAVLGPARFPPKGDIPSISETFPGYREAPVWTALLGPAGMPRPIVERLHGAAVKALAHRDVQAGYERLSLKTIGGRPEELAEVLRSESDQVGRLVKRLNIQPE